MQYKANIAGRGNKRMYDRSNKKRVKKDKMALRNQFFVRSFYLRLFTSKTALEGKIM
jgi:hypothetical protein